MQTHTFLTYMAVSAGVYVYSQSNILTRQPYRSCSAAVCRCAARHQSAAVVVLQQALITQPAQRHTAAVF